MIEFAKQRDVDGIIDVWSEAFGDKKEDILDFLKYYLDCMLVFKKDREIAGITAMIPVWYDGEKGRYIYAVATKSIYRGQGIAGKLVEFVKDYVNQNNEAFSILVPQNSGLFEYYKRFGYETISCLKTVKKTEFSDYNEKISEISENEYKEFRKKFKNDIIEWAEKDLFNIKILSNGRFLKIGDDAVAFVVKADDELIIKELLGNCDEIAVIDALANYEKVKKVNAKISGNEPFAMVYPKEYKDVYFNIAID